MKDSPVRIGRPMEVKEMVGLAVPPTQVQPTRTVTLLHSEDLAGRNIFEVAKTTLCHRSCAWCAALVSRCLSRGGKVT